MTPKEWVREYLHYAMILTGNAGLAFIWVMGDRGMYIRYSLTWAMVVDAAAITLTLYRHYVPMETPE